LIYVLYIFYSYMDTYHIGRICVLGGGEERHIHRERERERERLP